MPNKEHVITICPNFDFYLMDGERESLVLADLQDKAGQPVVMPALDAWAEEMAPIVVASETGQPYEKDWTDYHRRGLELARQLRRRLSSDYELWYEPPFEDKSGTIAERMMIDDVFEPVHAEAGGCYIQWVRRDNCKTEELLFGLHYFDYYDDDGSSMDTYTICPDGICFEAAGFGPGPWRMPEEDICVRISKEQYDFWVSQIEGLKKRLFDLSDGHSYIKDTIEVGDVIMAESGYFKVLDVYEDPLSVRARWLYIGDYGIDWHFDDDDDNWVEDPEELRRSNGGQHVDKEVFDQATNIAKKYREELIDELQENIYQGGAKEDS